MKMLVLQGSSCANGNTDSVLEHVLASAAESGADIEVIRLSRLNDLTGCRECYQCQAVPDQPGCVIGDDFRPVLGKALMADVILWATPVMCWSIAWPLKIAMDRFSCMFKFRESASYKCLLEGRKMAAVITAAAPLTGGGDLATEVCRRMAQYCDNDWLGALVFGHALAPDAILADADLIEQARAFGRKLASPG